MVVGYAIVDILTGERWGGLYESESGAKKSFDFHKGIQDKSFVRKMRWDNQDKFTIVPLTYMRPEKK